MIGRLALKGAPDLDIWIEKIHIEKKSENHKDIISFMAKLSGDLVTIIWGFTK